MDQSQNHQRQPIVPVPSTAASPSIDASPQDVLTEARKHLQHMIDSGISREQLHQWVDDSLSLQLTLSSNPTLASSHTQTLLSQHAPLPPLPPPPQCPPPPPPSALASNHSLSSAAVSSTSRPSTVRAPSTETKTEPYSDDMQGNWSSTTNFGTTSNGMMGGMDNHHVAMDTPMFLPPSAAFAHRPRISISSVSSGSSGHASIWSTNSAQSTYSYQSAASARSMAPLPMVPQGGQSMGMMNGTHVGSNVSNANRQNIYWCTSCETSFKRKYDWKRHEDEFHERWRKYPCPEPGCNRSFWGSNSFNQHHKQCHGCKTCPHAEKVVKYLRKRKYWACGFCSALHPARERHVEHVARHFESGLTKAEWMHSRVIYGLLHQPHVHEAWENLVRGKQSEHSSRRPQFSWHPNKTGRAQGFLEHEAPGQLQDHLEFFLEQEEDAHRVAKMAYELADIIITPDATVQSQTQSRPQFVNNPGSMAPPQHTSFASLSSQAHQQASMLPPTSPGNQNAFIQSFRGPLFLPSQAFSAQSGPSPESSSQSPMTASQSPHAAASSPMAIDKLDLQHSTSNAGHSIADSLMDYDLATNEAFRDWPSLMGSLANNSESPSQSNNSQQQTGWGQMFQYSYDPRVTPA
ncbi:hypothetical protein E4U38_004287 [Claviceps purpurea]|nr:hypothetical protein E4U38_004287 [Claviceps purpurea]KAG6160198.1 hypothetical protein E4U11_004036 [Claviceps purpurea]KAG6188240.1 hypothetical protein E4U27_007398 [Claviceps purpurea]KAG6191090.1 hypothetical protein E4U36_001120 [Claviceps purpurea]